MHGPARARRTVRRTRHAVLMRGGWAPCRVGEIAGGEASPSKVYSGFRYGAAGSGCRTTGSSRPWRRAHRHRGHGSLATAPIQTRSTDARRRIGRRGRGRGKGGRERERGGKVQGGDDMALQPFRSPCECCTLAGCFWPEQHDGGKRGGWGVVGEGLVATSTRQNRAGEHGTRGVEDRCDRPTFFPSPSGAAAELQSRVPAWIESCLRYTGKCERSFPALSQACDACGRKTAPSNWLEWRESACQRR